MYDQGFAAEIPEAYLLALQNSLQQPGNEIDYIGKTDARLIDRFVTNELWRFQNRIKRLGCSGYESLKMIAGRES